MLEQRLKEDEIEKLVQAILNENNINNIKQSEEESDESYQIDERRKEDLEKEIVETFLKRQKETLIDNSYVFIELNKKYVPIKKLLTIKFT